MYEDLAGNTLYEHIVQLGINPFLAPDTCLTNKAMVPVFIWFLGRIIREVKAMQEGIAMAVGYHSNTEINGQLGYAIKRLSSAPLRKSTKGAGKGDTTSNIWRLTLAESLFTFLLLATHRPYRKRLTRTRVAWSVNLEEFRNAMEEMLAEWTGTLFYTPSFKFYP